MKPKTKANWIVFGAVTIIWLGLCVLLTCDSHAGPWDGTLPPLGLRVPALQGDTGCGECQRDSAYCLRATAHAGLSIRARNNWRVYVQEHEVARDSLLAVRDWLMPVGVYLVEWRTSAPGFTGCWKGPLVLVSMRRTP